MSDRPPRAWVSTPGPPALQAVEAAEAPPAAAAAPSASDLRALEQQVAQKIKEARTNPQQVSADLLAATRIDTDHVELASGADFQVDDSFLEASAQEAATEPALPAPGGRLLREAAVPRLVPGADARGHPAEGLRGGRRLRQQLLLLDHGDAPRHRRGRPPVRAVPRRLLTTAGDRPPGSSRPRKEPPCSTAPREHS